MITETYYGVEYKKTIWDKWVTHYPLVRRKKYKAHNVRPYFRQLPAATRLAEWIVSWPGGYEARIVEWDVIPMSQRTVVCTLEPVSKNTENVLDEDWDSID